MRGLKIRKLSDEFGQYELILSCGPLSSRATYHTARVGNAVLDWTDSVEFVI